MDTGLTNKWIEINIDAVKNNLLQIQDLLDDKLRLIAVIKLNAYGHGIVDIARMFYQNGVDFFAVTFLQEALLLRKAGIRSSIMLFSPLVNEEELREALKEHITITVASLYDCELLNRISDELNLQATVHVKVDTGMGRFGLNRDEVLDVCEILNSNKKIYLEGLYTHMSDAVSSNSSYTEKQFNEFMEIAGIIEKSGIKIPVKHCANSAVFLKYPEMRLDAVRIGTLLSGQTPVENHALFLKLQDPYTYKSKIIAIKEMEKGSYLGYYRSYKLKSDAQVAVIPVGYSDGLALEIANKPAGFIDMLKKMIKIFLGYLNFSRFNLHIKIKGKDYPIRGKVFMQMALVEIPLGSNIMVGDEVEVPIRKTLASPTLMHIYIKDGQACKINEDGVSSYVIEKSHL